MTRLTTVFAQTPEIQAEIQDRLWFEWIVDRLQDVVSSPASVFWVLVALCLAAGAGVWLWKSRKRKS